MNRASRVRWLIAALVAIAIGCAPGTASRAPSDGLSNDPNAIPPMVDVLTYKGDPARLGVHPGPGPEQAPVVLWQLDLPVGGFGVPLIADGLVITASEDGIVRAIDAASGSLSWSVTLPAGVVITPTIAEGTLYLVTADGTLRTLALDDQTAGWTASGFLPDTIITVVNDVVLAGAPGEMVALGASDGHERWRVDAAGSDRSAVDGNVVYVSGKGSGVIRALNLHDGSEKWAFETNGASVLTPGIVDGLVYVAARDVTGGRNITYALGADGKELWHSAAPATIGSTAVVDDVVYEAIDEPEAGISALDRESGDVIWHRPLSGDLAGIVVVAEGIVYTHSIGEGVTAVDATSGEVRWHADTESPIEANLSVSGGLVFVAMKWDDGTGRVVALADPHDPRFTTVPLASTTPAPSATESIVPFRILSVDPIEGGSLLLSTAAGPDGTMYVADMVNARILIRAPDGPIESWGEFGSGPGQFNFTEITRHDQSGSVAVSPDGARIVVGDGGNHRVQVFDAQRKFLFSIGRLGRDDGQFVNPCCVGVDAEHRVWVVDAGREDVQLFSETGAHIRTFSGPGRGDGELNRPVFGDVDDAAAEVYIADFGNRRVSTFSTDGTWLRNYGGELAPGLILSEVNSVVLDRFGRLFVLDTTSRIFVLDGSGELVAVIPNTLPDVGRVELSSLAIDDNGRLYFADIGLGTAGRLIIAQLEPPLWPAE